jgi:DNA mismatch repair protein MutL
LIAFVDVDPDLVDVNVHPTKIEVKFVKEWEVHSLVASAIREALSSSAVAPTGIDSLPTAVPPVERPFPPRHDRSDVSQSTPASRLDLEPFREAIAAKLDRQSESFDPFTAPVNPVVGTAPTETIGNETDLLGGAVVLAQARNMYIVAQTPKGILLIDQHVAHERILYDKLSGARDKIDVQRLMIPLTLSLGRRESVVVLNKLSDLQSLGFDIESFGRDSFVVRSVPALIAQKNYEQILRDTVEELTELTLVRRLMIHRDGIITTTACKMAVKAGDRLSNEEMARLITDLRQTSNPYLCPHGRPIVVCLSNRELDKMFGRA